MTSAIATALPVTASVPGVGISAKMDIGNSQKFGSVIASITKSKASMENSELLNSSQLEQLADVLSMLNLESMTEWEDGQSLAKQLILGESSLAGLLEAVKSKEGKTFHDSAVSLGEQLGITSKEEKEEIQSVDVLQLISLILPITKLDIKDISKLDLSDFSQVVKTVKLLSLGSEFKDLTKEQTAGFQKLKEFLGIIAEKVQAGVTQSKPGSDNTSLDKSVPANPFQQSIYNSAQIAKDAYARLQAGESADPDSKMTKKNNLELGTQPVSLNTPLPKLEMLALSQDPSTQRADQDKFIKQFENILAKAHITNDKGIQKLFIKLNPEHLGSLRIEIIQKDSMVAAKIIASTSQAKDTLEAHINGLKHAFAAQNIPVDRIEVSQQFSQFSSERFLHQDQPEQRERQQPQKKKQEENQGFDETFEDALMNMEV
ncbi:flagellar hook-length control protein FliK [Peribacillus kribbensis]|uniref:flagellar hook-length control protein FliK n=1 Tax=Peribacillus kribbensis TaxID=356658 RepID=UPI0003FEF4EC|nr:flagellar hook-length control protein FliK [Peribacillus kribbensis]